MKIWIAYLSINGVLQSVIHYLCELVGNTHKQIDEICVVYIL